LLTGIAAGAASARVVAVVGDHERRGALLRLLYPASRAAAVAAVCAAVIEPATEERTYVRLRSESSDREQPRKRNTFPIRFLPRVLASIDVLLPVLPPDEPVSRRPAPDLPMRRRTTRPAKSTVKLTFLQDYI
jgi:hypothetical protein